jgi:hypothetical protein
MDTKQIDIKTKLFDPNNNLSRPVQTKDGVGVIGFKTTNLDGEDPRWVVNFGLMKQGSYRPDEMWEVEE